MANKNSNKGEIVIIGAGPAGMSCALELSRNNKKATILEKDCRVGGLAKTLEFKEDNLLFRTDIGPHRFFSKNPLLYKLLAGLLKEEWKLRPRKTRQFIGGKFYDYPINAFQALKNVGVVKLGIIFLDYFVARIKYKVLKEEIHNFEDYVVANFGKSLGRMNMLNYTEKIWGIPCKQIHPDWARQRIKGLNLLSALKNIFLKEKKGPKSMVDNFYYPEYGTGSIYSAMEKEVSKKSKIYKNTSITKINHKENKILGVDVKIENRKKHINVDKIIESIPITEFLDLLFPKPPKEVMDASKKLKWRDQVYLFITLNKKKVTPDNWIYFPDKAVPFARVSEMKNFSAKMSPPDKTSLFVEFFSFENDKIWMMSNEELFEFALIHFEKMGFFRRGEVRNYYVFKKKKSYPVYDLQYEENLHIIKKYLNKFSNLSYIGRPGRFKYNNQDHSLEMGLLAARKIIDNKKYCFDKSGSEEEYFEEGNINIKPEEKSSYNWMVLEDRE